MNNYFIADKVQGTAKFCLYWGKSNLTVKYGKCSFRFLQLKISVFLGFTAYSPFLITCKNVISLVFAYAKLSNNWLKNFCNEYNPVRKEPLRGGVFFTISHTFPALATSYKFPRACDQLQVFPRLSPVTTFPPLSPVTSFPALVTSYKFSRACHQLRLSRACHQLQAFPRLSPVTRFPTLVASFDFPALATGCKFLLRILIGYYANFLLRWSTFC